MPDTTTIPTYVPADGHTPTYAEITIHRLTYQLGMANAEIARLEVEVARLESNLDDLGQELADMESQILDGSDCEHRLTKRDVL